jgi:hypothetical protein
MMGTSCVFLLTKSSDLPLYYFYFFLHMYNYVIIDSGYRETSGYVGGFDLGNA